MIRRWLNRIENWALRWLIKAGPRHDRDVFDAQAQFLGYDDIDDFLRKEGTDANHKRR